MKKILLYLKSFLIISLVTFSTNVIKGQVLLYEGFDYTIPGFVGGNGDAGTNSNNWITHSVTTGQTTTIDLYSGSLNYNGIQNSAGNKILMPGTNSSVSRDINRAFTTSSTIAYFSAFVNVIDNTQLGTSGDYFMSFGATSGNSVMSLGARFGAKSVNSGSNYRLLILNTSGGTTSYTEFTQDLSFGTTYFVVVKYDRSASPTVASLWVNPSTLGGAEPSGSVSNSSGTGTFAAFASICLRNGSATPKVEIDEIRVGTTYADVTPGATHLDPPVATFNPANSSINVFTSSKPTITFDEAVVKADGSELTNADLATLITFKKTNASGANVSFTATIDATKKIITITPTASLDNSQIYYMAAGPVRDAFGNLSTTSEITFTTISATSPVVTLTNPAGGETFYANDAVSFTWTSENVTNVLLEVFIPRLNEWQSAGIPIPAVLGQLDFIIPADAPYGNNYKIRISDAANSAVNSTSGSFTVIAVASSLTHMRSYCIPNDIVKLNAEATVTYLRTNRNQKYIQDSGKGLLIDDASHILTTTLAPGDNITGLEGLLTLYHGVLELVPTKSSVTIASSGNIVTPTQMTIADYKTNYLNYESMLIKLTNVNFDAGNGTATFAAATNYMINDGGTNSVTFRTFNADETDIDGEIIPGSPINMTCVAGFFDATIQVYSQTKSEFELITAIERTSDLKTEIYPVPATDMLKVRNLKDIKDYEILDATGRTISKSKVATDNELNIPVSELKHGIYYVRFNTSSGIVIKKFVK